MTVETYIAVLHDESSKTLPGESVLCALQPDGTPKPVVDHHGVMYRILPTQDSAGVIEYRRENAT